MTKILVVDDEPQIVRALVTNLRSAATTSRRQPTARTRCNWRLRTHPDLLIVDLGLPGHQRHRRDRGRARLERRCRSWCFRYETPNATRSAALDAGADDYVTKALRHRRAAGTRTSRDATGRAGTGRAVGSRDRRLRRRPRGATGAQQPTATSDSRPTEWHVLETLARHHDKLVTQRELLQQVWGPGYATETNYLRVYMAQLRRKLEPDPAQPRSLITEAGIGYRLRTPTP